ncbi:hypothetical protein VUR80DRAFT_82 [Thermomyces stellatus]
MAMDALKNITNNVPDWLQRLGELSGQIEQRQVELAALSQSSAPSIRNRGSNESLLRKERDEAATPATPAPEKKAEPAEQAEQTPQSEGRESPVELTSSDIKQQTTQAVTVAQARARAQVRKRHRSQSIVSVEGNPAAYRSRSMIIVYYDSYVENFFEELVKFVSASRNLMRKAKMAAKVAQIKRMAEMDNNNNNNDDDDDEDSETPSRALPSLRYLSAGRSAAMPPSLARMRGARAGTGAGASGGDSSGDFYDKLDKNLEYVQSMCERAAHQFLRDADCNEEITNISTRLAEAKDLAEKESERILREEPELAKESAESQKFRTHRPPAVRRELSSNKDSPTGSRESKDVKKGSTAPATPSAPSGVAEPKSAADQPLEADDDDEGFEELDFKVSPRRTLRTRAPAADAAQPDAADPTTN